MQKRIFFCGTRKEGPKKNFFNLYFVICMWRLVRDQEKKSGSLFLQETGRLIGLTFDGDSALNSATLILKSSRAFKHPICSQTPLLSPFWHVNSLSSPLSINHPLERNHSRIAHAFNCTAAAAAPWNEIDQQKKIILQRWPPRASYRKKMHSRTRPPEKIHRRRSPASPLRPFAIDFLRLRCRLVAPTFFAAAAAAAVDVGPDLRYVESRSVGTSIFQNVWVFLREMRGSPVTERDRRLESFGSFGGCVESWVEGREVVESQSQRSWRDKRGWKLGFLVVYRWNGV